MFIDINIVSIDPIEKIYWEISVNTVALMKSFKVLTVKATGKKLLRSPRHRWEDNIRMDLKEIGISMRNWVNSSQVMDYWRALVSAELNLQVSQAMA